MKLINQISERITNLCEQKGISTLELSNISGISEKTLNNILQLKDINPEILVILKICKAFNITLSEFFTAQILEEPSIKAYEKR